MKTIETDTIPLKKRIDILLSKAVTLALFINRNTDMCCFIDDMAHCSHIEFRLHEKKSEYNSVSVRFKYHYEIDSAIYKDSESRELDLIEFVEFLENALKDKKIDYSDLYAETKEIIDYYTL